MRLFGELYRELYCELYCELYRELVLALTARPRFEIRGRLLARRVLYF